MYGWSTEILLQQLLLVCVGSALRCTTSEQCSYCSLHPFRVAIVLQGTDSTQASVYRSKSISVEWSRERRLPTADSSPINFCSRRRRFDFTPPEVLVDAARARLIAMMLLLNRLKFRGLPRGLQYCSRHLVVLKLDSWNQCKLVYVSNAAAAISMKLPSRDIMESTCHNSASSSFVKIYSLLHRRVRFEFLRMSTAHCWVRQSK